MQLKNLLPVCCLSAVLVAFLLFPSPVDMTEFPRPTETIVLPDMEDEADSERMNREKWMEDMHRAAPDVNWRAMDYATRWDKYQARQQLRGTHKMQALDTLANGNLVGEWFEKGSLDQSGRIMVVDLDTASRTLYAGSAGGHVWKGTVNGSGWTSLHDEFKIDGIRMIRFLPTSNGHRLLVAASNRFYYSDDDGATWIEATGSIENVQNWGNIRRGFVLDDSIRTTYLLVREWDYGNNWGAMTVLHRSQDQGQTFQEIERWHENAFGGSDRFDIWATRHGHPEAWLLHNSTIMELDSATGQPDTVSTFSPAGNGRVMLAGTRATGTTYLYAFIDQNIYKSHDAGLTWTQTGNVGNNPFDRNSFAAAMSAPDILFFGAVNVTRSTDGGTSWNLVNNWADYYSSPATRLHADIPSILPMLDDQGDEVQFISTDGGLYISDDTLKTVQNLSLSGLNVSQYYSVYTHRTNPDIMYAGAQDQGFQRSTSGGIGPVNFDQVISGDYAHIVSGDGGSSIWMVYPGFAHYYAYAPGGGPTASWNFNGTEPHWLPPLMADPDNYYGCYLAGGFLTGGGSRIIHLQANGPNITATQGSFDFTAASGSGELSALAYSEVDPNFRYAMTNNGKFFRSNNAGASWIPSSSFGGPEPHYLHGSKILASAKDAGILFLGGSGYSNPGVFKSENHGLTLTPVVTGLPSTMVFDLAFSANEELVFAATEVGPYVYVVAEDRWYDMAGGVAPDQTYWTVDYVPISNTVRFGTYGRGIWEFQIQSPFVGIEETLAEANANLTVYPNPVKDVIHFRFEQPPRDIVQYQLLDIQGKLVQQGEVKDLNAGVKLEAEVSSGVLLLQIIADGQVYRKRLLVE